MMSRDGPRPTPHAPGPALCAVVLLVGTLVAAGMPAGAAVDLEGSRLVPVAMHPATVGTEGVAEVPFSVTGTGRVYAKVLPTPGNPLHDGATPNGTVNEDHTAGLTGWWVTFSLTDDQGAPASLANGSPVPTPLGTYSDDTPTPMVHLAEGGPYHFQVRVHAPADGLLGVEETTAYVVLAFREGLGPGGAGGSANSGATQDQAVAIKLALVASEDGAPGQPPTGGTPGDGADTGDTGDTDTTDTTGGTDGTDGTAEPPVEGGGGDGGEPVDEAGGQQSSGPLFLGDGSLDRMLLWSVVVLLGLAVIVGLPLLALVVIIGYRLLKVQERASEAPMVHVVPVVVGWPGDPERTGHAAGPARAEAEPAHPSQVDPRPASWSPPEPTVARATPRGPEPALVGRAGAELEWAETEDDAGSTNGEHVPASTGQAGRGHGSAGEDPEDTEREAAGDGGRRDVA